MSAIVDSADNLVHVYVCCVLLTLWLWSFRLQGVSDCGDSNCTSPMMSTFVDSAVDLVRVCICSVFC